MSEPAASETNEQGISVAGRLFLTTALAFFLMLGILGATLFVAIEGHQQSKQNATLLRVVLAVTGCTAADTPKECQQRQLDRSEPTITDLVAEIDCRTRLAVADLPAPRVGEVCMEKEGVR